MSDQPAPDAPATVGQLPTLEDAYLAGCAFASGVTLDPAARDVRRQAFRRWVRGWTSGE